MILSIGTEPWLPSPPTGCQRESAESLAVVAHDPDLAGRDVDVEGHRAGGVAGLEVGLGDGDPVDLDRALAVAGDVVTGQADDPDEVVLRVVRGAGR